MPESQALPSTTGVVIDDPIPMYHDAANSQHPRQRDSELDELRRKLDALRGVAAPFHTVSSSTSERQRQAMIQSKVEELRAATERQGDIWVGPCAPFTVVNFNPVRLTLKGELQDQFVPMAGRGKKVVFPFKGRSFVGSYVTLTNAKVWPVCIGTENVKGVDVPSFKADYVGPIGIAYQFYSHYVVGARDAEGMGGILIFAGDAHTLDPVHQGRSKGTIRVPAPNPESSTRERVGYKIVVRSLDECLEEALTVQRQYAETKIAEGHGFANAQADDQRAQLSPLHIMWHNWAVEMGYKREPEKWAAAQLQDAPDVDAIFCPGCHQRQTNVAQVFCPNCNRPFDAYKAFMAGHPVPAQYLEIYEGAEWDAILGETRRRSAKRALLDLPEEKSSKKSRKEDKEE